MQEEWSILLLCAFLGQILKFVEQFFIIHIDRRQFMKHELNSQITKQMLRDAFLSLLEKKPISKITISELVVLCDVNRKTFYYHFADVYDLLQWHLNNEIDKAISAIDSPYDLDVTIAYSINYMKQHSYLQNCINEPVARNKFTEVLEKTLYPMIFKILSDLESSHEKSIDADFKEFLTKNITRTTVLSILDSIENPNEYDYKLLHLYISTISKASVNGFFDSI